MDIKELEAEYKKKRKELKNVGKLKSYRPINLVRDLRKSQTTKYTDSVKEKKRKEKATKLSSILGINDPEYIEFLLNKNDVTEEQFASNFRSGMYPRLRQSESHLLDPGFSKNDLSAILPSLLQSVQGKPKRNSDLSNILPLLSELKVDTPHSAGMYSDIITDYAPVNSTMNRRNDELARNMALYSQLTNDYKLSASKFQTRLNELNDLWGDQVGMGTREREQSFKPFLKEMMPVMEEHNQEFNRSNPYSTQSDGSKYNPGRRRPFN